MKDITTETIKTHDTLNPILFDENKEIKEGVIDKLLDIVDDFLGEVEEQGNIELPINDIVLVGSNVSYNYTDDSDIDLHIILDNSQIDEKEQPLYALIYDAYKGVYNTNHKIKIKTTPVELYVEFGQTNVESNGIYSLSSGWIKEPSPIEVEDTNEEEFEKEFKKWEDRYLALIEPYADKLADKVEDIHPDLTEALLEAKQDELNFQNKFGDKLTQRFLAIRSRLKSPENDYYYWIKNKTEQELTDYLTQIENTETKGDQKKEKQSIAHEGSELLYNKDGWQVYKILTYEASKYYATHDTKWCIAGKYPGSSGDTQGRHYFNQYKESGVKDYYFILSPNFDSEKHRIMWCYLDYGGKLSEEQFFDAPDNPIYTTNVNNYPDFFTIPLEIFDILPNINPKYIDKIKQHQNLQKTIDECISFNSTTKELTLKAEFNNVSRATPIQLGRYLKEHYRTLASSLTVENGVETIPETFCFAFMNLTRVNLPSSVKVIEESAFSFTPIEEIDLSNVEVVEDNVFSHCNSLKKVILNPNTEYLGDCFEDDGIHIDFYIKGKELNNTLQQGLSHVSKDKIHFI